MRPLASITASSVRLFAVFAFAFLYGAPRRPVYQQQYFPETGHVVRWPFLSYFNNTGGVQAHGFPITDDFVDPHSWRLVQYFEKSRMEWHPGNPEPYTVQFSLLGEALAEPQPPAAVSPPGDPGCLYFEETGHQVCHLFREYWLRNGGLDRFGYPITAFTSENGLLVQWFQRARMEWHPELPSGRQVQLAPLGHLHFEAVGLDPALKAPTGGDSWGSARLLVARSSVFNPAVPPNGLQTAYVFVTDQQGVPIPAAAVNLIIHTSSGSISLLLPPTDARGVSFLTFPAPPEQAGALVWLEFLIAFQGNFEQTSTGYLAWY